MYPNKQCLCIATAAGLFLAGQAFAGPTYGIGSGASFQYYGQLNIGYLSFDDGFSTTDELVDNANSNSRIGFFYTAPLGATEFRFQFETALGFRPSSAVNQLNTPDATDWDRTRLRKVDARFSGHYGAFYIGQGSMAGDGVAEQDFSGTGVVDYSGFADTAGGFELRNAATGALTGVTIGSAFSSFDGGRRGRIRYDTPDFDGFTLSTSYGKEILSRTNNDTYSDVALRYAKAYDGYKVGAAVGVLWRDREAGSTVRDTAASVSVLYDSGLNWALAVGDRDTGGDYRYAKIGYIGNFFSVGSTAFSLSYYDGDDLSSAGSDSESVGFAVVQTFDDLNLEAYLGYIDYSFSDTSGTSYSDASSVLFGARWKF